MKHATHQVVELREDAVARAFQWHRNKKLLVRITWTIITYGVPLSLITIFIGWWLVNSFDLEEDVVGFKPLWVLPLLAGSFWLLEWLGSFFNTWKVEPKGISIGGFQPRFITWKAIKSVESQLEEACPGYFWLRVKAHGTHTILLSEAEYPTSDILQLIRSYQLTK
jgi:hypothetical protein